MINILIAENDINYAKEIINLINSNFENARIFNISTSGYETLELLKDSTNIDIILLESCMPDLNIVEIISKLSSYPKIDKYINSIIILANDNFKSLKTKMIYCSFFKNSNYKLLVESLNKIIIEKGLNHITCDVRNRITNELTSLKYSLSHIGTKYLIDTIEIIYFNGDNLTMNLSKNVYSILAKHYNRTCSSIKVSIIRATEAMYYNCPENKLMEYFKLDKINKPNIKTVIQTVISNVKISR